MAKPKPAEIFKIFLMTEDGRGAHCHAIRHEGALWLVPKWTENPTQKTTKPERIIRLDNLALEPGGTMGPHQFDFLLKTVIPKSVLEGPLPLKIKGNFVVIDHPDIVIPMRAVIH